jgi:SAM-dependent methyltransferase
VQSSAPDRQLRPEQPYLDADPFPTSAMSPPVQAHGGRQATSHRSHVRDEIDLLYRAALRRAADAQALVEAEAAFTSGTLTPTALLTQLVASAEFRRLHAIEAAVAAARRGRLQSEPARVMGPPEVDERAVEIAWVLSRYRGELRVLDLGSANAERVYLDALLELAPDAVGVDIAPAELPGLDLRIGDVRCLPFPRRSFDAVLCISTLEHVGSSQEPYGVTANPSAGGIPEALQEIHRVLSNDGYVLITVPCGREEDHGWFVQHDRAGWNRLFEQADFLVAEQELYNLGPEGWRLGDDDDAGYAERGPAASAVLCSELRPSSGRLARIVRAAQLSSRLVRNGRVHGAPG